MSKVRFRHSARIALHARDLPMDAFLRARCRRCGKPSVKLRSDGQSTVCAGCGAEDADHVGFLGAARAGATCDECLLVCVPISTPGGARCLPCRVAWEKAGRPETELDRVSAENVYVRLCLLNPDVQDLVSRLASSMRLLVLPED